MSTTAVPSHFLVCPLLLSIIVALSACKNSASRHEASGRSAAKNLSSSDASGDLGDDDLGSEDPGEGSGTSSGGSGTGSGTGSGSGWNQGSGSGTSGTSTAGSGGGPNQNTGSTTSKMTTTTTQPENPLAEPSSYPFYTFRGTGTLTDDGKTYSTRTAFTTEVTSASLTNNITAMTIVVPDHQDRADDAAAKMLGPRRYTRPTDSEYATAQASGFVRTPYAIFAKSVLKGTTTTTWSQPLPVFPWTGKRNRYTELDAGPRTWTAMVNNSWEARVTVSKVGATASMFVMKILVDIPSDQWGEKYGVIGIPREAIYEIDTDAREVRKITMTEWYKNEDERKRETSQSVFQACSIRRDGVTRTFPCPN